MTIWAVWVTPFESSDEYHVASFGSNSRFFGPDSDACLLGLFAVFVCLLCLFVGFL